MSERVRDKGWRKPLKWFVISEWNGRVHCHTTDQPFQKSRNGEQLGRERERYLLTPEQCELPLDVLLRLADAKELKPA